MRIVRKTKPGQPLLPAGESVAGDEALFNQWYDSQLRGERTFRLDAQIAEVLKRLRDRHLWIACDCQGEADRQPLLCPIQLDSWGSRYSFRRIRSQFPHHPTCIFHIPDRLEDRFAFDRTRPESSLPNSRSASQVGHALRPLASSTSFVLDLTDRAPEARPVSQQPTQLAIQTDRRRSHRWPKLARMLFTLLEEAQLNVIRPGWWRRSNYPQQQYRRLQRTKRHIINRIPLRHYLTTEPEAIAAGCQRLEALLSRGGGDWPPHVKPQAWFVGLASQVDIERRQLYFVGKPDSIAIEEPPICFAPPHSHRSAPYWAIAQLGESKLAPGQYVLRQAYTHPVYSTSLLVPVDSDAERQTLALLLELQRLVCRQGIPLTVTKPLHDFASSEGEPYRPDFVLYRDRLDRKGQHNIVVETMGFDNSAYLARKDRTHPRMAELGEVIPLDWSQPLTPRRKRAFQQALTQAIERIFQ
ncbi:hypothetical protein [Synechococcus sp. PCC 7336]|uniref:hypothetical protein n=1 Tax=Synechococcus sp. PCC 7336 TaxID=195250 RepID=UPI0003472ADB|nr:hypothetical protein [Synechococcus sp. PCC 7336]